MWQVGRLSALPLYTAGAHLRPRGWLGGPEEGGGVPGTDHLQSHAHSLEKFTMLLLHHGLLSNICYYTFYVNVHTHPFHKV